MRRTLLICAVAGSLGAATACGGGTAKDASGHPGAAASATKASVRRPGGRAHTVTLEVLGKGSVQGIRYSAGTTGSVPSVALPWKKTGQVSGGALVAVLASDTQRKKMTCRITVDGKVVAKSTKTKHEVQCRYTLKN